MATVRTPEWTVHHRGRYALRGVSESWGRDELGWKKGVRFGSTKDGKVVAFIEDLESTTEEHSGAEAVGVDSPGNVYGGVVRRKMLEKHVKPAK
jgi:hypothetical protein